VTYPSDISFRRAVAFYSATRRHVNEQKFIRPLVAYFGGKWPQNITAFKIDRYRQERLKAGAAMTTVNKEVQVLKRVLAGAGIKRRLRMLPREKRPARPVDMERIAQAASDNPLWQRALTAAALAALTGLERARLRKLTWECVDPFRGVLTVDGVEHPLPDFLRRALIELERERKGRCRITDSIIAGRSWKRGWRSLRLAAGVAVDLRDVQSQRLK
jgi:integrase